MYQFTFETVNEAYRGLLDAVLTHGKEVSPRGMLTKEIMPVMVEIKQPRKREILSPTRNLNYGFGVAEFLWMLRGSNSAEEIGHYNKQWLTYSDDGETLNGAYGHRIFSWPATLPREDSFDSIDGIDQFEEVYQKLKADPDSRQGTIIIYNPTKDFKKTKDVPCTNLLRFNIRDGKLNMIGFMRSNDLWFGFPYDVWNFTMFQELLANRLGVEVGSYYHIVDSMHVYSDHFEPARKVIEEKVDDETVYSGLQTYVYDEEQLYEVQWLEDASRNNLSSMSDIMEALDRIESDGLKSMAALIVSHNFIKKHSKQTEGKVVREFVKGPLDKVITW